MHMVVGQTNESMDEWIIFYIMPKEETVHHNSAPLTATLTIHIIGTFK